MYIYIYICIYTYIYMCMYVEKEETEPSGFLVDYWSWRCFRARKKQRGLSRAFWSARPLPCLGAIFFVVWKRLGVHRHAKEACFFCFKSSIVWMIQEYGILWLRWHPIWKTNLHKLQLLIVFACYANGMNTHIRASAWMKQLASTWYSVVSADSPVQIPQERFMFQPHHFHICLHVFSTIATYVYIYIYIYIYIHGICGIHGIHGIYGMYIYIYIYVFLILQYDFKIPQVNPSWRSKTEAVLTSGWAFGKTRIFLKQDWVFSDVWPEYRWKPWENHGKNLNHIDFLGGLNTSWSQYVF